MKILFLVKNTNMFERLGFMYLSSVVKPEGHQVRLMLVDRVNLEDIVAEVWRYDPAVIGYSIMTGEHNYHIELNQFLKQRHKFFAVFGGPHPTFKPDIIHREGVDAICIGEGEYQFLKLVEDLEHGRDYLDTHNFWFKRGDRIIKNDLGSLIDNLDELPFPDRELMYSADPALAIKDLKLFMAMRGCPYLCTYCFNHAYNRMTAGKGRMLRYRSVDNMIREILEVKKSYILESVWIDDDTFLIKPEGWLEELAERFSKEVSLPMVCNIRPNLVNDHTASLLRKMNCELLSMGVECGNEEVATKMLKRHVKNNRIEEACQALHKQGLRFFTMNMVGLPVDDPIKLDLESLDFNIRLKPSYAWSSILYPYPETEIGKYAISIGMFSNDHEKLQMPTKTGTMLNFDDPMIKRQITNLHKLFGIIVAHPWLRPLTTWLISLPLERFYTYLYFIYYGWQYVLKPVSWRRRCRMLYHYIKLYLNFVPGLEKKRHFPVLGKTKKQAQPSYPNALADESLKNSSAA